MKLDHSGNLYDITNNDYLYLNNILYKYNVHIYKSQITGTWMPGVYNTILYTKVHVNVSLDIVDDNIKLYIHDDAKNIINVKEQIPVQDLIENYTLAE